MSFDDTFGSGHLRTLELSHGFLDSDHCARGHISYHRANKIAARGAQRTNVNSGNGKHRPPWRGAGQEPSR